MYINPPDSVARSWTVTAPAATAPGGCRMAVVSVGLALMGGTGGSVAKLPVSVCLTPVPLLIYATGLTAVDAAVGSTAWNVYTAV